MAACEELQIITQPSCINCLDICGKHLASGSSDRLVRLYSQVENGKFEEDPGSPLLGHHYAVHCVRFHRNGSFLVTCSTDGCAFIWDIQKPSILAFTAVKHSNETPLRTLAVALLQDILVTSGNDGLLTVWSGISSLNLKEYKTMRDEECTTNTVSFTSDGNFIISGHSDGAIRLWDAQSSHSHPLSVSYMAHDLGVITSDIHDEHNESDITSYLLVTGGNDDNVKIWKISCTAGYSISLTHSCVGHASTVCCVRFYPNGQLVVSTGDDYRIKFWDPGSGVEIYSFKGHERSGIFACALSNSILATGSSDKTIRVWKLTVDNVYSLAEAKKSKKIDRPTTYQTWTVNDVCCWLTDLGFTKYVHSFEKHHINGLALIYLNQDFLQNDLAVGPLGDRLVLLKAISILKCGESNLLTSTVRSSDVCPDEFKCPISCEIMEDPVVAADGFTYEGSAIRRWFGEGNVTSPMTNVALTSFEVVPNKTLLSLIKDFKGEKTQE